MQSETCAYALLAGLALALVIAAATDLKRREIDNWLNTAVALGAPLYWLASGYGPTQVLLQLALAVAVLGLFAALFQAGAMGGGDAKLLTALALWVQPAGFARLVVLMSLAGGVLTLGCMLAHRLQHRSGAPAVPYGVAIAAAGLWTLASHHLPALRDAPAAWSTGW
ncbi:MAG: prepilin peptidase [Novosphingobium sp.]